MNRMLIVSAASLSLSLSFLAGCNKETASNTTGGTTADNRTAGEKVKDGVAKAGEKTGDALGTAVDKTADATKSAGNSLKAATQPSADSAMKDSRDTLSSAVEAALTNNGLNDVVDRLTKADRDRIGKIDKASLGDLNAAIGKLKDDWKAKYNADFKLSDKEQVVFGTPVAIKVGDIADNARLAGEKLSPTGTTPADKAADKAANNTATVSFPSAGDAPMVNLTLRNEGTVGGNYKIDVPDTLDANTLKQNLIMHINKVDSMKDKWPADANEAARVVSQHILAAISDAK